MPDELQELSPKPDFEAIDTVQSRVPKLAVRGRAAATLVVGSSLTAFKGKDSKESLQSTDENTLSPPSPNVAPWEAGARKFEPRPPTAHSQSFTFTNERHSSDAGKQPFRQEVCNFT